MDIVGGDGVSVKGGYDFGLFDIINIAKIIIIDIMFFPKINVSSLVTSYVEA